MDPFAELDAKHGIVATPDDPFAALDAKHGIKPESGDPWATLDSKHGVQPVDQADPWATLDSKHGVEVNPPGTMLSRAVDNLPPMGDRIPGAGGPWTFRPSESKVDPDVSILQEYGKALKSSLLQTGRGASGALEGLMSGMRSIENATADFLGMQRLDQSGSIPEALQTGAADSRQFYEEKMADPALQPDPSVQAATYESNPFLKAGLAATHTAVPFATGMAASVASGSPAPMLAMYGTTAYGDTYANAKATGASETAAQTTAMVNAAWQALSERFGVAGLLDAPKRTILANIAAGATRESIQETIQQIGSNLIERIGYDGARQWTDGLADAAAGAFVLGFGGGAFVPRARQAADGTPAAATPPPAPNDWMNRQPPAGGGGIPAANSTSGTNAAAPNAAPPPAGQGTATSAPAPTLSVQGTAPAQYEPIGDSALRRPTLAARELPITPEAAAAIDTAPDPRRWTASTPQGGMKVSGIYDVVDLDNLVISDNPAFPVDLQPRKRTGVNSQVQVEDIARELDSARMAADPLTDAGAPIVSPDNLVLSGNGRSMALRRAHEAYQPQAAKYHDDIRARAAELGIDTTGMARPVLVRRLDPRGVDAPKFVELSNRDRILSRSPAELAEADGKTILDDNLAELYTPDETGSAQAASNRDFVVRYIQATGATDILDSDGRLSADGETRIKRAMLSILTGTGEQARAVTHELIERADVYGVKPQVNAIMQTAGRLAKVGKLKPDYNLLPHFAQALKDLVEYRRAGLPTPAAFLAQQDMFASPRSEESLQIFNALATAKSAIDLRARIERYLSQAEAIDTTTPDLFGAPNATAAQLVANSFAAPTAGNANLQIGSSSTSSPLPAPRAEGNRPRRSPPGASRAGDNPGQPSPGQGLQLTAADLTRPPAPAVEAAAAPSVLPAESIQSIPLGLNREPVIDRTLARLSDQDFDNYFDTVSSKVDALEGKLDENTYLKDTNLGFRSELANAQDKYSAATLERLRRDTIGRAPEDVLSEIYQMNLTLRTNAARASVMIETVKDKARFQDAIREIASRGADQSEVVTGKLENLLKIIQGVKPADNQAASPNLTLQSPTTAELDAEAAQRAARDTKRAQADQMAARAAAPLQGDSSGVGQGTLFAQDADLFSGPAAQDQAATDQAEPPPSPPDTSPPGDPSAPIDSIPRDFDPDPKVLNGVRTDTGKPVGTGDIIRFISKAFDIPLRTGGFRKAAEGIYRSVTEAIRLKRPNTLPVAFHELGHYLHNVVFPGRPDPSPPGDRSQEYSDFAKAFDSELLPLGRTTSTPSYTEHQVRMEGVAEFLREYMSDRANAIAIAPTFTAHFETETAKNADLRAAIDAARQLVTKWKQQPAGARIDAQIRSSHDGRRTFTARQILSNIYTKWVDQTAPINRTLDSLVETGADPGLSQAIKNRITNFIGGWRGKVEHALHHRAVNLRGVQVGEGLRAILADAEAATPARLLAPGQQPLELFRRYIVAKHALEDLMPRNIDTGLLRADVQSEVAALGPVYESHFRRLIAFQKTQRDLLVDAGLITRAAANAMDAKHQWYVPFHRFHQGVAGRSMGGSGTGFVNTPTGIRRMKGSTREIIDPLETIIKNAYVFRELAERNRIGNAFARILDTTRGAGRVGDRVAKKLAPTNVGTDDITRMLEQAGVDPTIIDEVRDAGPAGQVWRAIDSIKPRDGIFKVWRNGKEQHYQIDDPELYRALTLSDTTDAEILARFPFLKTLNWATRILRSGATLSIDFITRNPVRDQFTAAIYSKNGSYIPVVDFFKGMFHVVSKDALYQKWVRDGGRYAHMVGADKTDLRESFDEVMSNPSAGKAIVQALNPLRVLTTLNKISTLMEESTRVMLFQKSLQAGATSVEAANLSKDGTLNFSRHGTHGKLVNMLSAFFNAGVQDLDKFIRAHADPEQRAGVMLRGFMYITIPSILAWALGKDDDDIQNLPQWRKNAAWNFKIPGSDTIYWIPKPFLLGTIYGNSVESALDYIYKDDPAALNQLLDTALAQLPAGGPGTKESLFIPPGLIPDLVQTAVEGMSNYSFFREGPIVPQRLQSLPKTEQYTESTSQTARAIGQATGTSPMIVDNAIRNTFAGLGRLTVDGIDAVILKLSGEEIPPRPARPLKEQIPGLRAFVVPELEPTKRIDQVYTGLHNAEAVWKAAKSKDPVADAAWFTRNREALVYYRQHLPRLRQIADDISDLNTARRKILGARNLTPDNKRARLLAINKHQDLAAQAALKHIRPEDTLKRR